MAKQEERFLQNKDTGKVFPFTEILALSSSMREVSDIEARKDGYPVGKGIRAKGKLERFGNLESGVPEIEQVSLRPVGKS